MRGRRKGGKQAVDDGFSRDHSNTLASLFDKWSQRLAERNYGTGTLETQRWALRSFLKWTQEQKLQRPDQITLPILERYQGWLFRHRKRDGKPLSVSTQRARLGALQRFFSWLCRQKHLGANPAADLELPRKPPAPLPRGLTSEELEAVFKLPDGSDALGIRDRAILETFYATGIRRSELVGLDVGDLETRLRQLHVRKGKGGRGRVVPVGDRALRWLQNYLQCSRPNLILSLEEPALFVSGYGDRLSAGYVGNWVSRMLKSAGIQKPGSCHLFRHSCATHMLENGADIRFIQELLGHARLDTTQIYTKVSIQALHTVYRRCHPAARPSS